MKIIMWFIKWRWEFKRQSRDWVNIPPMLTHYHNNNLYGCRKHPVIYNDMCRIVRGVK